jgi:hypothetical protein
MTVLTLEDTVITPIAGGTALTINQYVESEAVNDSTSVRTYAGGVKRAVTTPGREQLLPVSYRFMSRADYASLVDLVSVPVLFRDQRGRAVFGVIAGLLAGEFSVSDLVEDVSFTLLNITYSEVV